MCRQSDQRVGKLFYGLNLIDHTCVCVCLSNIEQYALKTGESQKSSRLAEIVNKLGF